MHLIHKEGFAKKHEHIWCANRVFLVDEETWIPEPYDCAGLASLLEAIMDATEALDKVCERLQRFVERHHESGEPERAEEQSELLRAVKAAKKEIIRLRGLTSALPANLGNVFDLPPELIEELSATKGDELENQLVTVINSYGGVADLDQILVGLYRKFKLVQKRRFIQNKLYRMTKSDIIWSIPGRKGVYSTKDPNNESVASGGLAGEDSEIRFARTERERPENETKLEAMDDESDC